MARQRLIEFWILQQGSDLVRDVRAVMAETCLLKFTFERVVVSQRQDFDNYIDVPSCTNWSRSNVGHKYSGRATANKHKSFA